LYVYNLISGLLLADVAISLHESSECEVPGSFKDFVDTALRSDAAGTLTAGASLLSNGCFLAYGAVAAGSLLADTLPGWGLDPVVGTVAFAAIISLFAATQSNAGLERIANAVVMVVFSSFAALLMPSIASVSDPVGTFLAPGTNPGGFASAVGSAVPLLLSSLMYQNIVPSITKLLDFDRAKTTAAIAIGSLIPMGMYIAWCYAALGGGLDGTTASGAGAAAFTAFSASALFVSCLTAVMSLAEEYESLLFSRTEEDDDGDCPTISNRFSIPAVAASVMPPVAVALAFAEGGDLTGALHFNGAFIVPFLYGLLPIILYRSVRQYQHQDSAISISSLPQVLLGAGTVCALGQEIVLCACTYI
jgi:tyrosine-specific transport protein